MAEITSELRSVLLVSAFTRWGTTPVRTELIHAAAYFVDVFARSWNVMPLRDSALKTGSVPHSGAIQAALDRLVGRGVLAPSISHNRNRDVNLRREVSYALVDHWAGAIVNNAAELANRRNEISLVDEIVASIAYVNEHELLNTVVADASYSDPLVGQNAMIELGRTISGHDSLTVETSAEMARLARDELGRQLSPTEIIAIYLRHLHVTSREAEDHE